MSTTPEPGGTSARRDNGLVPARWSALAALDPAASDAVLSALARRGVAALVEPGAAGPSDAPGEGGSGTSALTDDRHGRPRRDRHDLLWVDAGLRAQAEALLVADFARLVTVLPADGGEPGPLPAASPGPGSRAGREGPLDEDAAWAEIVAGWGRQDAGGPVPRWPVDEDVAGPEDPAVPTSPEPAEPSPPPAPPVAGPRDHRPRADPADDHYLPPPPPPLPRLRRNTVAALLVLALGVVLLFAPRLVGLRGGDGVAVTAIACIVGSVAVLVHGMRDRGAGGDGWDDGAVV